MEELLPLTPAVFHILLALSEGEKHGYSIMQEIDRISDKKFRIGPATLYRSIQQMLKSGFIEELEGYHDTTDDERRRYYRLTELGIRVAKAELHRLSVLMSSTQAQSLLRHGTA